MLTKQEIFDQCATHLFTQGRPAYNADKDQCLYRGPDNTRCAVGYFIPDDRYEPKMDGPGGLVGSKQLVEEWPLSLPDIDIRDDVTLDLLAELQSNHDTAHRREDGTFVLWTLASKLRRTAKRFQLTPAILDTLAA